MKILLTGFEPFGGESINPSWEAVRLVRNVPEGMDIVRLRLPVTFAGARESLRAAAREHRPDVILSVGQAGGREGISLERIAVNLMDARIPDNAGFQPVDEPLYADGPAAYFSSLPLRPLLAALQEAEIPASISNTAGLYVCNAVFYEAARLKAQGKVRMAGFIHVPYLPGQAAEKDAPSLPLDRMVRALEIVFENLGRKG